MEQRLQPMNDIGRYLERHCRYAATRTGASLVLPRSSLLGNALAVMFVTSVWGERARRRCPGGAARARGIITLKTDGACAAIKRMI
jgi:hypothetical protein